MTNAFDIFEYVMLFSTSVLVYSYLVILESETLANIKLIVALLILIRLFLVTMGSWAVYVGLRRELDRILAVLGTSRKESSDSVPKMVSGMEDGEL